MAEITLDLECNDPKELYSKGIRAYILQDYETAVAGLGRAAELFVGEYKDDMHESLGEVYLYYGKALLETSRQQNEALGDRVPKDADESEEEVVEDEDDGEDIPSDAVVDAADANVKEPEKLDTQQPGTSSSETQPDLENSQNEEEDATDLQLAWEILELSKKIFQKIEDKKNLAETLVVLGEVSLESENFQSAIVDIKQGLDIQKEIFSNDSRTLAETMYKLAMAYSTNSQVDEAMDYFRASLDCLENRIKILQNTKSSESEEEIEEIRSLLPDIEEKIVDMRSFKEETMKKIAEQFKSVQNGDGEQGTSSNASKTGAVTNISHLVKRKRKPIDDANGIPVKKPSP